MAVPFKTSSTTNRTRSASDASDIGSAARARIIAESTLPPSPSPHLDVSPIQHRRGSRNTWTSFFTSKPERRKTLAIFDPPQSQLDAPPVPPPDEPPPRQYTTLHFPKVARKRVSSPPTTHSSTLLGRSFTTKPRPLSRIEGSPATSPALPGVFASLPARTRERIRSSYDSTRRSHEQSEGFTSGHATPISDLDTPANPTSFRASTGSRSSRHIKRRSMASFARPPITSAHTMRRISALPLRGGDDLRETGESYRTSTADLSDFLRATGPEDPNPGVPTEKLQIKDVDRDGANSTRSRTRSSIFRIGGRKREKSRPRVDPVPNTDDVPPLPAPPFSRLPAQDDTQRSFSPILRLANSTEEGVEQSARSSLQSSVYSNGRLPPNTREHRLRDGTTILMITTPRTSTEPKILSHSKSLGSITTINRDDGTQSLSGTLGRAEGSTLPSLVSSVSPVGSKVNTHSPTVSISSDGTLSTSERPRIISGEGLALLSRIRALESSFPPQTPQTPPSQTVGGRSISMGAHDSYLQVQTPKSRPRGYSSPDPVSPTSAESTPTITIPTPTFSPSASIAPTPELTPHKSPVTLPEHIPTVTVVPPRKNSATSPIVVDGLQFPAPPLSPPKAKRRPNTMDAPPLEYSPDSPPRTSRSMRAARSTRNSGPNEADSAKARSKKAEHSARPSPLNLDAVPTYREWKSNPAEVHTQPGELTGLELDLDYQQPTKVGKKRQSLMEQHQQLFLNANPFQTPPSPSGPLFGPSLGSVVPPPLESGPPAMPLPPSPRPFPEISMAAGASPISIRSNDLRHSTPHSQRSRFDSLMVRPSPSVTPVPASPVSSDATHALTAILTAQREQFDGMSKHLLEMVKSFEEEKRAYEQRIQELTAAVNEKEAKAKEDERKIKGLEWLVGNLNLRAGGGKAGNTELASDSGSNDAKNSRRRSSFPGLGAKDDTPMTPLPIDQALDPVDRAKRAASMDDVLQNLIALSQSGRLNSTRSHPDIYEWATNTALQQD
ncbi:hypothetical protein RHS04_01058 [Rhizoctonia solani]|uniref:Uncharacterized protein n=1 Tax=Rhizoctonia solani TaxID=456999 RepID=A0A8H7HDV6_9AGAM|nr:hypothetical protein RHS04_01058 [Rhizoctonia solani]